MQKKEYSHYAYDANFVLRVPLHLWLIIIWSIHHGLLIMLGAFSSGDVLKSSLEYGGHAALLISDIPGLLMLVARMNRLPAAGARTRWIWRRGRPILAAGLVVQLCAILWVHGKAVLELDGVIAWAWAATLMWLLVLLKSQHIADTFADFPAPGLADTEKK